MNSSNEQTKYMATNLEFSDFKTAYKKAIQ